ncbi:hypothetical protein C0584_03350 [Candidatus Parcubacteria bacterium]|nr:MAG: hypothetical protein C0584_03350 [Candidatus Parcubacteria bacterium]
MKKLKFKKELSELILEGEKTSTWRLFDDKDLRVGDKLEFLISESLEKFALAEITEVLEKTFRDLRDNDWAGHEKYESEEEMFRAYSEYYEEEVNSLTKLKIIKFKIINE